MRLGVDVGGTFTDLLLHDDKTKRTYQAKTPSTPEDQSIGVAAGVKLICDKAGIQPSDISLILHGTTVATNAVLEGKGSRVGLLVTEGFEYTLHLAKSWTPGPLFGWIVMDKPDPLASLADTRGIPERLNARGEVVRELDRARAIELIDDLCSSGIEALTISLMHSTLRHFTDPARHHRRDQCGAGRQGLSRRPACDGRLRIHTASGEILDPRSAVRLDRHGQARSVGVTGRHARHPRATERSR